MNAKYPRILVAIAAVVMIGGALVDASEMDKHIESSAKDSYVFKTFLKGADIETKSVDGVVTLKGTVDDQSRKLLAEETVASMPGVKSVDNQLQLIGDRPEESSDGWISMQVKYSLLYNRHVSGISTQVYVTDGIVTLRGEAKNRAQKDLAGEYAKDIKGVKEVKNEMTVASPEDTSTLAENIDDASITAQVKTAFLTHHSTSGFKTDVNTKNGIVTLEGRAGSEAGKRLAAKIAGDVRGVSKVINNMTVEDLLSKN